MPKKTSLAVIVPCYNESLSIPFFAAELKNFYVLFKDKMPDSELKFIVVDNNSSDDSKQLLELLAGQLDYLSVESCVVQGYGAALKHGFARAKSDYLSFLDLDNTYPMSSLIELLDLIQRQNLDLVYGARIHSKSDISFVRKSGNLLYVYLLKFFLKSALSDVCSGMRIFKNVRRDEILRLTANDLSFSIQLTAFAVVNKWNISELAISYRDRVGESKLSVLRDGFNFLWVILKQVFSKRL